LSAAGGEPAIWVNGARLPANAPHVSARDRGLTLADGLFETMHARRRVVFRLAQHLDRLERSLDVLQIPRPADLRSWVDAALSACEDGDAAIRLTVTRGPAPGGLTPPRAPSPTVIAAVTPFPAFSPVIYDSGLSAHVPSGRRNERAMTSGLKTLCYTDAILGMLEAERAGADEALFLDTEGHCSEASSSNLFAWTGDTLLTPPVACGALPGITRAAVLEIAAVEGLTVAERAFGLDDLARAREAFLTSSLRGIAPLVRVDGRAIGDGAPGARTRAITAAYAALVDRECR
jgi:branched-chain amino acid aminotransferase